MARTAFIVEDEPLARQSLRDHVDAVPWLRLVGSAADGRTAVKEISRLQPDLVFLDVQIPEWDGLEVLRRLDRVPAVIFTTAHDDYAIRAFELGAVDYLVKPFGSQRFQAAVERFRNRSPGTDGPDVLERLAEASRSTRFFARQGERILPVPLASLIHVEATDDYVTAHTGEGSFLLALTLSEMEEILDKDAFLRVHRSHIVNLDRVVSMQPADPRRLRLTLTTGRQVTASRSGSALLKKFIK